jgi:hypothetical protein
MAQYLCAERPTQILGQDLPAPQLGGSEHTRGGHEPMRPSADTARRESRPGRGLGPDPIRAGRDALLATLNTPLEGPGMPRGNPAAADAGRKPARGGAAALMGSPGSAFDDDRDSAKPIPDVPSLAVLRPRRGNNGASAGSEQVADKPRKRLPSWDDVLFGGAPAARESS